MRRLVFLFVFLLGCSDVGEQTLNLKAAGLWLTANPLDAPPGALSVADNAVIRRPGIVEPRRGQQPDTDFDTDITTPTVEEMAAFEGNVIAHVSTGALAQRTGFDAYSYFDGTYTAPSGHPMRFAEAGGGLYFTTDTGPQRLDSLSTEPVPAGTPPGLEGSGTTTGSSGWLANTKVVGYRFVWGSRDADGALLLGAPSGRVLVSNTSGGARDVALSAPIPDGIVENVHFLQVYRTVITADAGDDPGEDMAQVAEIQPTAAQIAAGVVTHTDIASFANGPTAYFSPGAGVGLADAKEQPGLLTDALAFRGYLFGVVNSYRQTLLLSLLAVDGSGGLAADDGLVFQRSGVDEFMVSGQSSTEDPAAGQFEVYTAGTAAENIEDTARSLVRVLNGYPSSTIYASYASGPTDLPGKIALVDRSVGGGTLSVVAYGSAAPWVPQMGTRFVASLSRTANVVTATVSPASAIGGLAVGQSVTILLASPADPDFPLGTKTIASIPGGGTFTYAEAGINATSTSVFRFQSASTQGDFVQEATPGSWATSAFEEPDAWPPRFRYQVGGPNTTLYRITSQGEALLFWTSDGLYRLTGNDEDDFTLRPLDPTINLVGASTPVNMGNRAFALTSQGVVSVTELGVEKVSTPIDTAILPYYGSTPGLRAVTDTNAFAVGYQSENEYALFLPNLEGLFEVDQAYVFNIQTGTWVRHTWSWEGINEDTGQITAAVVNPADNYLYLSSGTWITRERKDRNLTDYQDADDSGIPFDVAYQVQTAKNPGALKQWGEVACLLEAPQPSSVDMYFTTEIDSNEEGGTINSQGNKAVRTYLPRNKSRSARLAVGLRHDAPLEKPTILGLSVVYNTNSTRVGR